jgi:ABC-type transport system involved in multi-copper enzyme maturation permease subunit
MSATTFDEATRLGRDAQPGFGRLIRVELRKMYDTRAGFWLLLTAVGLATLVAALSMLVGDGEDRTFANALDFSNQVINFLVPIVGILLVTSEWSQRTAQVTFTLVPQRGRVLVAKIGAAVVLAVAAFLVTLVLSALFTAIGSGSSTADDVWSLQADVLLQSVLFDVISVLIGVAIGAAILLSAPAIVASFVLPIGLALIMELIPGLNDLTPWLDQSDALSPLTADPLSGKEWAQVLVCTAVWCGLPMAIGFYRFLRNEVR